MWKVIVLSAILGIAQGASISDVYGNHTALIVFSVFNNASKTCVPFTLSETPSTNPGSCSDGNNLYSVTFQSIERYNGIKPQDEPVSFPIPLAVVDSYSGLEENLKATCTFDGKVLAERAAVWSVNDNYHIAKVEAKEYGRLIFLVGKHIPTAAQLEQDVAQIDELKGKSGNVICNQEIYQEFRSGN